MRSAGVRQWLHTQYVRSAQDQDRTSPVRFWMEGGLRGAAEWVFQVTECVIIEYNILRFACTPGPLDEAGRSVQHRPVLDLGPPRGPAFGTLEMP